MKALSQGGAFFILPFGKERTGGLHPEPGAGVSRYQNSTARSDVEMKRFGMLCITLSLSVALALPCPAAQETVDFDRVEVTGSRLADTLEDVPAPVYVVTAKDAEASGARSLQEVLDRVPGVVGLVNSASMTQGKGTTIRGLTTEVLLLVDGIPVMNSSYGTGAVLGAPFDLRTIPLSSVDRVEIVKGASSALYGSHAAGGVINVITKSGAEKGGASLMLETGNADWFRGSVRGTATADGFSATVGYTRTQEGKTRIRLLPDGSYDHATDFKGDDYLVRFDGDNWFLQAGFGNFESEWEYTDFFGVKTRNSQENDYRRFLIGYADGVYTVKAYYNENQREMWDDAGRTEYGDSAWGITLSRRQKLFGLSTVLGVDWRNESSRFTNRENPWGNDTPYDLGRKGLAPYMELSIPLGEVSFDLGLRYEYWSVDAGDDVSEFIPRFSFNWESPGGRVWYLTVGRFFAMPSFYQMFMPTRSFGLPNPDLKPEDGWTWDLGVRDPMADHPWSLGVFFMDMSDKIQYEYDPATWMGQYVNLDEFRAWGVEGEVTFRLGEHWSYTQGFSWTKAEEKRMSGSSWTRSGIPRWDVFGRLNYASGPWSGELSVHYYGDREIRGGVYDDENMFFVNASVAWTSDRDTIRLRCSNLLDEEYVLDSQGYLAPERRFSISWEHTF